MKGLMTCFIIVFTALQFILQNSLIFADILETDEKEKYKDFYIITLPKSGSHLLLKLAVMLTNRYPNGLHFLLDKLSEVADEQFEEIILKCKEEDHFAFNHTSDFGKLFSNFSEKHPEYVKLLMIRDLRDTFVSYAYQISHTLEEQFDHPLTMDEKLTYILDKENYEIAWKFEQDVTEAIRWMSLPNVLVCRFEELVGPSGGGGIDRQEKAITAIADHLGIQLSENALNQIVLNLFGNSNGPQVSGTFRSGQVGSWKTYFNETHRELFEKYWGSYQLSMGYDLENRFFGVK